MADKESQAYPVTLSVERPDGPRNRLTVLVRPILVIPILIIAALIGGASSPRRGCARPCSCPTA